MSIRLLLVLGFGILAGCAAEAGDEPAADEADFTDGRGVVQARGDKAERIIGAFDAFELTSHAMGGRASVDEKNVVCLLRTNAAIDPDLPEFMVPTFDCQIGSKRFDDPIAKARVLFEAMDAVPPSLLGSADVGLVSSAMAQQFGEAKSLSCESKGRFPDRVVTCRGTSGSGKAFSVDGKVAARLAQALELAGAKGLAATDVSCNRHTNGPLQPSEPLFDMPVDACSLKVDGRTVKLDDGPPRAEALLDAIAKAGIRKGAAMQTEGVVVTRVRCKMGPGEETRCGLDPRPAPGST
jgi:hypothetical protein